VPCTIIDADAQCVWSAMVEDAEVLPMSNSTMLSVVGQLVLMTPESVPPAVLKVAVTRVAVAPTEGREPTATV
jgi:hypothetical protein